MPPGARIARLLDVAGLTKVFNVVDSLDGQLNRKDSEIRHVFRIYAIGIALPST